MKSKVITVHLIHPITYFDGVNVDTIQFIDIFTRDDLLYGLLSSNYEIAVPMDNISAITGVDFINNS